MDNYSLLQCKLIVEGCMDAEGKASKVALIKAIREAYCEGVIDTKVQWFDAQFKKE